MKTKPKNKDVWQIITGVLYLDRGEKSWVWISVFWSKSIPLVNRHYIVTRAEAKRRFPDAFKKLPRLRPYCGQTVAESGPQSEV